RMKWRILYLFFITLTAAQIPFNIFSIPASIRDPMFYTIMEVAKTDTQCFRDIKTSFNRLLLAALTAQKCKTLDCFRDEKITNASYALKMLASTGHPHSLHTDELSVSWSGDPKLCRSIEGPFDTKYCYMHVSVDWNRIDFAALGFSLYHLPGGKIPQFDIANSDRCNPLAVSNVKVALCIPASCEKDTNIGRILHNITKGIAHLCEVNCVGPKAEPSSFFYIFNTVFISLLCLAIVASLFDYYATNKDLEVQWKHRTGWKVLMTFSVPRNTISLFSLSTRGDAILCLDAIRFITFTWVANGHSDLYAGDGDNSLQLIRSGDYFLNDVLLNGYAAVDTFFLLSGLLLSYTFFKKAHSNPEFVHSPYNWIMYYVHRWLRLTPSYMLFVAAFAAWTPQMHDVWAAGTAQNSTRLVENCANSWWLNALYLNNFLNIQDICFPVSWFLCVDTQLYWTAPLFLVAIYYSWKTGLGAILGGALFSIGSIVFLTWRYNLPAIGFTAKHTNIAEFSNHLYVKPWTRCIPYLAGIVCGYFIVQIRKNAMKLRIPKRWELIVYWLVSTALGLTVVFAVYNYGRGYSDWSITERALYGSFARIGWSMAVAWVVFACTFDWAGPVKYLLEHPLWYPLGRLSYCAFLAHLFVLHYILNLGDRPAHLVSLLHTYLTLSIPVVFVSYVVAYVWSCLVEIPFAKLE
ncbi:hypothetical protein PMAYCL1PPCAC_16912, partial [Pristionchus mayeri]